MTGGSAVGGRIRKLAVVSFFVCGMLDGPAVVVVMTPNRKEVFPKNSSVADSKTGKKKLPSAKMKVKLPSEQYFHF